ncbi:hypothetical protein BJX61DRAFT_543384 [Aspergillus egyptiacus]|nr:hypothetical protein BJX61DRAFT_543384 [Aspergillus egyptiacus]
MTANQERQWQENTRASALVSAPSHQHQSGARVGVDGARPSWEIPPGKQDDGPFIKPKCAVYFGVLQKASWENFGIQNLMSDSPNIISFLFRELETHEANALYRGLSERLQLVEIGKKKTNSFQKAISEGMDEASAREFASRKLILEAGQEVRDEHRDSDDDEWIRNIDKVLCAALRWKHLVDTMGVPEIALIQYETGAESEWDNMPVPDIRSVSNEEYDGLLQKLLEPALGLKETCLKLSGVVGMIQRLKDLTQSDLRTFLAQEIRRRVEEVLGSAEPSDMPEEEEEEEDDDDDESMADEIMEDAEISHDVDFAGLDGLQGVDFSRI